MGIQALGKSLRVSLVNRPFRAKGWSIPMKQLARISNQVTVSGFILCLLANGLPAAPWDNGIVKVSADHRCLVHENGKPFSC